MGFPARYYATIIEGWQFPAAVETQQRFRKSFFIDQLGWALTEKGGIEYDEFDTETAIYCSLFYGADIVGCWRIVQANESYLSRTHFPQLATFRPYPTGSDCWEVSRFGAIEHPNRLVMVRYLYGLVAHFARTRRATSLVGVFTPGHHRFLTMLGVRTRPYGHPQIVGRDARGQPIEALASEIFMPEQTGKRFEQLCACINEVDVKDEALVLRRRSIPA
jgi:N-acyl-L-homoserine lactone synthetase